MNTKTITVRTDFQPAGGAEYVVGSYPGKGAFLVEIGGFKQIVFVGTTTVFTVPAHEFLLNDGTSPDDLYITREAFLLDLVATCLNPGPRSQR